MSTATRAIDPPSGDRPAGGLGATVAEEAGAGPRIHHEPALDGLRGLAVAAVVVFHLGRLDGGFLGVDLFFVLSGFLITSLLVAEHRNRGSVHLGRFWVRRARRLLPALFLMMVGVGVLLLALTPQGERARFRGDALATLGYVANWHRMVGDIGYWDMFSAPSPLDHTWSLAIEEQFYVLWPLVAVLVLGLGLARRRAAGRVRPLAMVAVTGAVVSFGLLALTWAPGDTNRGYYGSDTRIGPTLLGAALAVTVAGRPRRAGPPAPVIDGAALGALGWMGVCTVAIDGQGPSYYRGGLASFAVSALVVILAVTGGPLGPLGRAIAWRPLRWLGTVSYGVYLWHWPVIVFLTEDRAGVGGLALDGLRVAVTLAVAAASFWLVERPIRRGVLAGRRLVLAGTGSLVATLAVVLIATSGTPAATEAIDDIPVEGSDNPYLLYPADIPGGATRLLLVGDSGVYHLGPSLATEGERAGVAVASWPQLQCTVVNPEGVTRTPDGHISRDDVCHELRREHWAEMVAVFDPDVVVYYLANAGGIATPRLDGEWVTDCDPAYDRYLADALREDADTLGGGGGQVVIATTPYVGILDDNSHPRVDCRNDTYRRVVEARPGTRLVDLNAFVEHEQETTGVDLFADPVHFSPGGARRVSDWLLPELRELLAGRPATGQ